MNHRLWSLKNLSIQTAATVLVRASWTSWTSFDFIMGCSPRVNEDSESRWIIRFCFIKLEEKPFHSFHSSSNRERRESEIMIDYLSKKYNYMLQNGGKYHCHNRFHLSCGFDDHSRPPQNDLDPSWSFPYSIRNDQERGRSEEAWWPQIGKASPRRSKRGQRRSKQDWLIESNGKKYFKLSRL